MTHCRKLLCAILLLSAQWSAAREVTDTLVSTKNDRVIITYDVVLGGGKMTVSFRDAKKRLGRTAAASYKRLDEVAVVFFDRIGNFRDIRFSGLDIKSFMVPANMRYAPSDDGYFLLGDRPTLTFDIKTGAAARLSIPVYLAHYDKKGRYTVFALCGRLAVTPPRQQGAAAADGGEATQVTTQTFTSTEEVESAFTDADEANILIRKVSDLLREQDEYPFSDELHDAISSLRDRSYRITDAALSARISDVLAACREKEDELKGSAKSAEAAAAAAADRKAAAAEAKAQARQDSIEARQQQQAEKDKKRNIFMIIGGVVLAALAFVGNQTFQHFRNARNQKSIMDMQESVVRRAENEAKRRAQSMARNQAHKAESQIRNKVRSKAQAAVDSGKDKLRAGRKNNKGFSI